MNMWSKQATRDRQRGPYSDLREGSIGSVHVCTRYDRSIHGVGAESTAVMRLHRIDVHAYDIRCRQIDTDAHVLHAWMRIPSRCECGTLGVRKRGTKWR